MTTTDRNLVSHLMQGMVKCRHCEGPMEIMDRPRYETPSYVCIIKSGRCAAPVIEAEPFNRLVVRRAIHAVLGPQNIWKVRDIIIDQAMRDGNGELSAVLDRLRPTPTSPEKRDARIEVWLSGHEDKTIIVNSLEELRAMPDLDYDTMRWIPPEDPAPLEDIVSRKVEEYSLNPDTYLRPSNLHTTRAIITALLREIMVGPDFVTIHYGLPVNPGRQPELGTSEEVPIGELHTSLAYEKASRTESTESDRPVNT